MVSKTFLVPLNFGQTLKTEVIEHCKNKVFYYENEVETGVLMSRLTNLQLSAAVPKFYVICILVRH